MKNVSIGLFGFGVVGEGIYHVLNQKAEMGASIKKVVIKQESKPRNAPQSIFSSDPDFILKDDDIDLVVELIDDADAALSIVTAALANGKSVVSANKKMIAENHESLIEISQKNNASFLYEAAVCGSVPIIRNLEEYFDNDLLRQVQGIVNGSTNYILSKMSQNNQPYDIVLSEAQDAGFAESDPTLDVEGIDASYKLSILTLHAFGKRVKEQGIIKKGITSLCPFDFQFAREKGQFVKLIARCTANEQGELNSLTVLPEFVTKSSTLGRTNNEYNGVLIESSLADEQFLYGKGAGRYPTASAVLSDISAYRYQYRYEYKKGVSPYNPRNTGSAKFYVSFDEGVNFDQSIFNEIDESFHNGKRSYIIGDIDLLALKNSDILTNPQISLISCN